MGISRAVRRQFCALAWWLNEENPSASLQLIVRSLHASADAAKEDESRQKAH